MAQDSPRRLTRAVHLWPKTSKTFISLRENDVFRKRVVWRKQVFNKPSSASRWPQDAPRWPHDAPRWPRDGPSWPQDEPWGRSLEKKNGSARLRAILALPRAKLATCPLHPQILSSCLVRPQIAPKWAKDSRSWLQDGRRWPKIAPDDSHERSTCGLRRQKHSLHWGKRCF